jgi:hypothetical protein
MTFSLQRRWSGRPWGQCEAGWRWWLACSASVQEEEEGGRAGRLAVGPKARGNSFRNKIGFFLNLQMF